MLLWLATADRPLQLNELVALASVQVDKQTITGRKIDPLETLKPAVSLVFLQDGQVYLRHGLIRAAILDVFSKGKLIPTVKDRHADFVTRLLVYLKSIIPEQHEPSLIPLDRHDTTLLVQRNPLLDFAVRYWPRHLQQTTVFKTGGEAPTAKEFGKIFPVTVTLLLLQSTLWQNAATPTLLTYQTVVTNLARQILTPNSVVTLQSIISLAVLRRDLQNIPEAIPLFYEITTLSRTLLTTKHIVTMQMASLFLDLTAGQVTNTKTEIMFRREEVLLLIVECYKIHYSQTSEIVVSTLKIPVEHYRLIKDEKKAQEIIVVIHTITKSGYSGGDDTDKRGNLHVHLKGHKRQESNNTVRFTLDVEEDELVENLESFDFEVLLKRAEQYVAEGKITQAERLYVEIWQRASKESHIQYFSHWEDVKLKAFVVYSKFL